MDMSNFLVALSLLVFIFGSLCGVQAFLEVLKSFVEIKSLLELRCNDLIDSHELSANFFFNFLKIAITCFVTSSF